MSKFKVGDKVRYIGGDKPNDPMNLGYMKSMLRNGEVGIITEIKTLSKGVVIIVQHDKRGGTHQYIYDPNWLALVEDKPKLSLLHHNFNIGDIVEFIGDRVGYPEAPEGPVEISDFTDRYVYVQGYMADSGKGWLPEQFKLAETVPKQPALFKPDDYVICTDASGSVVTGVLEEGQVYRVRSVYDKGNFIALHDNTGGFRAERFAPLNSTATTVISIDEATTLTLGEQDMSIDTTVAVLNKTFIYGKDADTVTVDDVFNHITRLEAEAAKYDSIKNKPKAIKAKVDALKAEIESLVKFSDEKFSD